MSENVSCLSTLGHFSWLALATMDLLVPPGLCRELQYLLSSPGAEWMMKVLEHPESPLVSFSPYLCGLCGWAGLPVTLALRVEGLTEHRSCTPSTDSSGTGNVSPL